MERDPGNRIESEGPSQKELVRKRSKGTEW